MSNVIYLAQKRTTAAACNQRHAAFAPRSRIDQTLDRARELHAIRKGDWVKTERGERGYVVEDETTCPGKVVVSIRGYRQSLFSNQVVASTPEDGVA